MQTIRLTSSRVPVPPAHLFISGDEGGEPKENPQRANPMSQRGEDLPYRVEVWSEDLKAVEQTLAMTANGSIGYAAYYEATREYPDRYVVLRHRNRIVARWNPPES